MRWLRFVIFICLAAVLQASFLASLHIKPDLLLILLVFFAIYCDTSDAIITSFTIGFAADIIGSAMGPQMISFGVFGTLLAYLHRVIAIRKMSFQAFAIFAAGVLTSLSANLLVFIKGQPAVDNLYVTILVSSLYSSLVGPFLFLPSTWWMHMRTHRFSKNYVR